MQPAPRWLLIAASVPAMVATFPPLDLGWLAWFAMVPALIAFARARSARSAFASAYVWGFSYWGWVILWIGATVATWSGSFVGWGAWFFLATVEALWFGLFGIGFWWIFHRHSGPARALASASWWIAIEWLRSLGSLSMPWALLGYTQHRFLLLAQCADVGGVYLVGFLPALLSSSIAAAVIDWHALPCKRRILLARIGLPATLVAIACVYGAWRTKEPRSTATVTALVVQPNLPTQRAMAWGPEVGERLHRLANAHSTGKIDIAVWPESVTNYDATAPGSDRDTFQAIARRMQAYQIVGTACSDEQERSYTSAALFAPDGSVVGRYDKRHLVPFGEWTPFRTVVAPLDRFFHFVPDTTAGRSAAPLNAGLVRVGGLICYESAFPNMARDNVLAGANILANITNDSWAGDSGNIPQHLAMTQMRAIETRRSVLIAALTGATGIVSPSGRMRLLPPWREGTMEARVHLSSEVTLYTRLGDWFPVLCLIGAVATGLPRRTKSRARGD